MRISARARAAPVPLFSAILRADPLFDLLVVMACVPLLAWLSLIFHADTVLAVLLYYGVPTAYLCYRKKKNFVKIAFSTITLGLLFGMAYDLVIEYQGVWVIHYDAALLSRHTIGAT